MRAAVAIDHNFFVGFFLIDHALFLTGCKREIGTWRGTALSCQNLQATCGASGGDDCCKSLSIPGGRFHEAMTASISETPAMSRP